MEKGIHRYSLHYTGKGNVGRGRSRRFHVMIRRIIVLSLLCAAILLAACASKPRGIPAEKAARESVELLAELSRLLPTDADLTRMEEQLILVGNGVYRNTKGEQVPLPERSVALERLECVACSSQAPNPSAQPPKAGRYQPILIKVE